MLLEIKDLKVKAEDKQILKGLNLTVNPGEVHAIMGPNGSARARSPACCRDIRDTNRTAAP